MFDIFVEEMSQQRVMRQFNLLQDIVPPPPDEPLLAEIHELVLLTAAFFIRYIRADCFYFL
jgi:hypothetical protein